MSTLIHAPLLLITLICCPQEVSAFSSQPTTHFRGVISSKFTAAYPLFASNDDGDGDGDIISEEVGNDNIEDLNCSDDSTATSDPSFSAISASGVKLPNDASIKPRKDKLPVHTSVARHAGPLWTEELCDDPTMCTVIPHHGQFRKRVLVLCTGGTLTMDSDPSKGNSLAPVQGALTNYLAGMTELTNDPEMPEVISHEYQPLIDSSDMGPVSYVCFHHSTCACIFTNTDINLIS